MKKVDAVVMKLRGFAVLAAVYSMVLGQALIAGIGDWKSYTDMKGIRAVAAQGKYIWAATSGGVFRFNTSDSTFLKFTNSDGLSTNDVTAIAVDKNENIWIGHANGSVDIYSTKNNMWKHISDIRYSTRTDKRILSIYCAGDSILFSTGFGISVFSISKFEFRETYTAFATITQAGVIASQYYKDRIFAITSKGFVVSKVGATNLVAPESWEVFSTTAVGNSLTQVRDSLFAGSNKGVLVYKNSSWITVVAGSAKVFPSASSLLFSPGNIVYSISSNYAIVQLTDTSSSEIIGGCENSSNIFFAGFSANGIGKSSSPLTEWSSIYPNGPSTNSFVSMAIDESGVLWAASGRLYARGFYAFDGNQWKNFDKKTNPNIPFSDSYKITMGPNNTKWISGTGGVVVLDASDNILTVYDSTSPGFNSTPDSKVDVLLFGGAKDNLGNMWFSNFVASQNKALWKKKINSGWESYTHPMQYRVLMDIVIDHEGTKWFTNGVPLFNPNTGTVIPEKKFVFYNESNQIAGTTEGWGELTVTDGMTSVNVLSLAVDTRGDVWAGTNSGITIISTPRNPKSRLSKVYNASVRDQSVTCIAVDPLNNKWIGTSQGVFVLSPDGITLLQKYTVESTEGRLVDNNILSIVFDTKKGIAYFGTDKGLSALEIMPIQSEQEFSTIKVSPNPVKLSQNSTVEIRGLVDDSIVKILSITGKIIHQFSAQGGGRAFWNLKDSNGNYVGSGVYIIAVHNSAGDKIKTAKVAVIRN